jgi:hypothetical protein
MPSTVPNMVDLQQNELRYRGVNLLCDGVVLGYAHIVF